MAEQQNLQDLLKANGYNMEYPNFEVLKALPKNVKKRVCALKKLQLQSMEIESKFYERVHQLEKEFESEFNKVFQQRTAIVSGAHEPTDEEADIALVHGVTEDELKDLDSTPADESQKGIPEFWLNVLKNSEVASDMIQDHDEEILKFLTDITTSVETDPQGFSLYFHFAPNPFFSNTVLKKEYTLQMKPNAEDPFEFDGPSVVKAVGDEIKWNEGKNVTQKVIKKKAKKGANAGKFLTKTVKADSFFNFFEPPTCTEGDHKNEDDDEDEECFDMLRADFEVGQMIRDHIVPRAVLFLTGEAVDGDMFDDYDEDDEMDDDDEEDEE